MSCSKNDKASSSNISKPKQPLSRSLPDPGLSPIVPTAQLQEEHSNLQIRLQEAIQRNIMNQLPSLIANCLAENTSSANFSSEYIPLSPGLKECMESQMTSLKEIKNDIATIKDFQNFQSEKIRDLEDLVYDLEEELFFVSDKLEDQERRSRLDNLEFHGIAPQENEDTDNLILELGKTINVDIKHSDISVTHRSPTHNSNIHKPIIAKFTNRKIRARILKNRHLLKTAANSRIRNISRVFIVENLTDKNKNLFYQAKVMKRRCGYAFLWTSNGKVLIKKNKDTNTLPITDEDDLDKIR
uniref:uncharacterized protein LOC120332242 n=1 Tax=Styela clava TaxID=7725 RepID=UPI001939E666|nr:uncharacterized protein LOC120332242 [Styela clava]